MKKTMNGTQEIKIINLLFDKSSTVSDKKHKKTMNKKQKVTKTNNEIFFFFRKIFYFVFNLNHFLS